MEPTLADPFELPGWLADREVVWEALDTVATNVHVHGVLRPSSDSETEQVLDLMAVDAAWPTPACDEANRRASHQAWHYGEVAVLDIDSRVALGVPVSAFTAEAVCDAVRRFTRAVGADPKRYAVQLRL
ncbi:MAG: hypothetical protein GEU93_11140 [Propionibacteriales bacterium]|nr:hypothetical protein [Propionibacteriales bacterium]